MMRISSLLVAATLLVQSTSWARPEFLSLQERAQGYSLTGGNLQNDSLYSNPASSAFTKVYSVEAVFAAPRSFGVSILDTKTSAVGGALGYFRESVADRDRPIQGLKLGLIGQANEWLGVGIAGKTVWGPAGAGADFRMNDADVGVLLNLSPMMMGVTVRNALGGNSGQGFGRELAFGAQVNYDSLLYLSASAVAPWGGVRPDQIGIGVEYVSPFYFSLKGGYRFRPQERVSFWSAGASLLSPRVLLHYAAEFPQNQPTESIHHAIAAAMQF